MEELSKKSLNYNRIFTHLTLQSCKILDLFGPTKNGTGMHWPCFSWHLWDSMASSIKTAWVSVGFISRLPSTRVSGVWLAQLCLFQASWNCWIHSHMVGLTIGKTIEQAFFAILKHAPFLFGASRQVKSGAGSNAWDKSIYSSFQKSKRWEIE